jgi:hypothetical protein
MLNNRYDSNDIHNRIVEINGIRLMILQNIDRNRKNYICTSNTFQKVIDAEIKKDTNINIMKITKLLNKYIHLLQDIKIVKFDGNY